MSIPIFDNLKKWVRKKDDVIIDNLLFRVHHQLNFAIVMIGLIFIVVENYFDSRAIVCKGNDVSDYSLKYCWIHGTGYVHPDLQGEDGVTACVASSATEEDKREINYYLWLPLLLVALLGLAKLSRTVWKGLEGGLISSLVGHGDGEKVGRAFLEQSRFKCAYFQLSFFFCEMLNVVCVFISMYLCDELLINKFWSYGVKVGEFMKTSEID